jgi:phage replication initiation protein
MPLEWALLSRAWQGGDYYQMEPDWVAGCLPVPDQLLSWADLKRFLAQEIRAMRGVSTPYSNYGGNKVRVVVNKLSNINKLYNYIVDLESRLEEPLTETDDYLIAQVKRDYSTVLLRIPRLDYQVPARMAFLDWVSLTIGEEYYGDKLNLNQISNDLKNILGFGISGRLEKGLNGYTEAYDLGEPNWGHVALGGDSQHQTLLVGLTGQGCAAADWGWESRLQAWLEQVQQQGARARLTRVDLAFDDYQGRYLTPVQARKEAQKGSESAFFIKGRPPSIEIHGSWDSDEGRGKTCYIGSKTAPKRLKVYEKGKQLGDPTNPWVRIELTLRNKQNRTTRFELPLDILTQPGSYLAGAYSTRDRRGALGFLLDSADRKGHSSSRLQTMTQTAQVTLLSQINSARRAAGKLVNLLLALELPSMDIIDLLRKEGFPPRLKMPFNLKDIPELDHLSQPILIAGQVLDEVAQSLPSAERRAYLLRQLKALQRVKKS